MSAQDPDYLAELEQAVKLQPQLSKFCVETCNVPRADAQDIVQEAFIRLFKEFEEDRVRIHSPHNWLFSVVRNLAIDFHRRRKPEVVDPVVMDSWPAKSSFEDLVFEQEQARFIWDFVKTLPPDERDVIDGIREGKRQNQIASE